MTYIKRTFIFVKNSITIKYLKTRIPKSDMSRENLKFY